MDETTSTVVIGAGQAGLAVSHCLTARGIEHVVLDRGRVAERWRSERWDSLRLLTPNWMSRLPGYRYTGDDPDGFMTTREAADFFGRYAASFAAPVRERVDVRDLSHDGVRFHIDTSSGTIAADNVVIATGWCDRPAVPSLAAGLATGIEQITPSDYRNPDLLPSAGVLVVGASSTGVQLADEIHRSGRRVIVAVGSHARMPRTYRGMDSFWWLDQIGAWDRTIDEVDDARAARSEPALQLVGRPDRATLDLTVLQQSGVELTGRLVGVDSSRARFDRNLSRSTADADAHLGRLLARIDRHIARRGLTNEVLPAEPIELLRPTARVGDLDLVRAGIGTVVWATGFRRSYPWLRLPILDGHGEIVQRQGVTPFPGAYVLGQRFQHFRNSNFIDGVGRDADIVATHISTRVLTPSSEAHHGCFGGRQ